AFEESHRVRSQERTSLVLAGRGPRGSHGNEKRGRQAGVRDPAGDRGGVSESGGAGCKRAVRDASEAGAGGVAANGSGNRHQGKREKEEVVANELAHSFGPVHSCGSAFSFAVSPRAGPPALWRRRAIPGRIGPTRSEERRVGKECLRWGAP